MNRLCINTPFRRLSFVNFNDPLKDGQHKAAVGCWRLCILHGGYPLDACTKTPAVPVSKDESKTYRWCCNSPLYIYIYFLCIYIHIIHIQVKSFWKIHDCTEKSGRQFYGVTRACCNTYMYILFIQRQLVYRQKINKINMSFRCFRMTLVVYLTYLWYLYGNSDVCGYTLSFWR